MYVASLWSRSFFLRWITADPSPWGNFTPPTKYECGETLGDLEPVYDLFSITSEFGLPAAVTLCETRPAKKVVILNVNHRRLLTLRKHNCGETWVGWGPLSLFKTCFRAPKAGTQTRGLLVWIFMCQKVRTQACGRIFEHHARCYIT